MHGGPAECEVRGLSPSSGGLTIVGQSTSVLLTTDKETHVSHLMAMQKQKEDVHTSSGVT